VDLLSLASGGIRNPNIWYPTILGVLVVASAIFLFVGGTYMLLATNTGARLGFLITVAGLSGMMLLLSTLWWTTGSPLNTLKGRLPQWVPVESIEGDDLARSDIPEVQDITSEDAVPLAEQTNIKAAIDSLVVIPTGTNGEEPEPPNEFQTFTESTDYLVDGAYEIGGESWLLPSKPFIKPGNIGVTLDSNFPWIHVTGHQPAYAVAVLCPIDEEAQQVPFGDPTPPPTCDASQQPTSIVLEKDLGSVRFPPFMTMIASAILFVLSLLGLHWRERDLQELAAEESEDETADKTPATVDA
jgi:hypothetical protein